MSSSPPSSSPQPLLTLKPSGPREVMDEAKAEALIEEWKEQIASAGSDDVAVVVDQVTLKDKSWTAPAALKVAAFFTSGAPSVASTVTKLDVSDVIASRMEDEGLQVLQILCDAFKTSSLKEVNLSDNAMGLKGISACLSVLTEQASTLEKVWFENMGLSAETMEFIADILTGSSEEEAANDDGCIAERLKLIHFYNNMSGEEGCKSFCRILSQCTNRLEEVRFSGCRAGASSALLASALDSMGEEAVSNLRKLDLTDSTFFDGGADSNNASNTGVAAHLSRALGRCKSLTHVKLRDCSLEDLGIQLVCHALWQADCPLVLLDLSGNEITNAGVENLTDLLEESLGTLEIFHAEDNELTSLGVRSIAETLASGGGPEAGEGGNSVITEIRLGGTKCGTVGAYALMEAYKMGMPNLKVMALDHNTFLAPVLKDLQETFPDSILEEMEENDDEEDADDTLEEDDGIEEEDEVDHSDDADVNDLADALVQGAKIDGFV